jgi:hypothetical protein
MTFPGYIGFWWRNLKEEPLGRTRHNVRMTLKCILNKYYVWVWTGQVWLRIQTTDGLL